MKFIKEKFYGFIEYKLKLHNITPYKLQKYTTQMRFRLIEGNGKAIYLIGVHDEGHVIGIKKEHQLKTIINFMKLLKENNAKIKTIYNCFFNNKFFFIILIKSKKYDNKNFFF